MNDEDRAREVGIVGGQGRTDGEVYANGQAALWAMFLIAAALVMVVAVAEVW